MCNVLHSIAAKLLLQQLTWIKFVQIHKLTKQDDPKVLTAPTLVSADTAFPLAVAATRPRSDTVTTIADDLVATCWPAAGGLTGLQDGPSRRLARIFMRMSDAASECTCSFFFSIRWRASANLVFCSSLCLASTNLPEFGLESFWRASNLPTVGCCNAAASILEDALRWFPELPSSCCLWPNRPRTLNNEHATNRFHLYEKPLLMNEKHKMSTMFAILKLKLRDRWVTKVRGDSKNI